MTAQATLTEDPIVLFFLARVFRASLLLATAADALQTVDFSLFAEGICSPADDTLDCCCRSKSGSPARLAPGISDDPLPNSCPASI
jgi:hypothetical protein